MEERKNIKKRGEEEGRKKEKNVNRKDTILEALNDEHINNNSTD